MSAEHEKGDPDVVAKLAEHLADAARLLRAPSPELVAGLFCQLDDDGQARFFSEVAAIFRSWDGKPGSWGGSWQVHAIAGHMNTCSCGADGRAWVEDLHESLQVAGGHHDTLASRPAARERS